MIQSNNPHTDIAVLAAVGSLGGALGGHLSKAISPLGGALLCATQFVVTDVFLKGIESRFGNSITARIMGIFTSVFVGFSAAMLTLKTVGLELTVLNPCIPTILAALSITSIGIYAIAYAIDKIRGSSFSVRF